jgi:PLP dependent protein
MTPDISSIAFQLTNLQARIHAAERAAVLAPTHHTQLLAVSKGQPLTAIQAAIDAGLRTFGENYLKEALVKIAALSHVSDLSWHFIGRLQSNKLALIAQHFDWVHSVTTWQQASQLNQARQAAAVPLNICIQVNTSHEPTKAGVAIPALPELAEQIQRLPYIKLRGLMTIPKAITPDISDTEQRAPFRALHSALDDLNKAGHSLDTLSMGMSADFELAIQEGSTIVRIGTLLFGPRSQYN